MFKMASLSTCHLELVVCDDSLVKTLLLKSKFKMNGWWSCIYDWLARQRNCCLRLETLSNVA